MSEPMEPHEPFEPLEPGPVKPVPRPPAPGPYKPSPLPAIATAFVLGGILVGAGFGLGQMIEKKTEAPAPSPAPAAASEAKPAAPDATAALPGHVEGLTTELQGLGKRLNDLQKQVGEMPKPAPAPDLKPVEAKVDALAKRLDGVSSPDPKGIEDQVAKATAAQADSLAKLSAQASALEKALADQKGEIASLRDQVKSLSETKPAPAPAAAANGAADADFARAVDLYKKGQYAPARDAFAKLQESSPNDARVWYFGALSTGSATNVWTGETERLVTKGVDLEKAGSPDAAKINSAFADLNPPAVKTWLDFYRAKAR